MDGCFSQAGWGQALKRDDGPRFVDVTMSLVRLAHGHIL